MSKRKTITLISVGVILLCAIVFGCVYFFGTYLPDKRKREDLERQVREYYENKLSLYREENEKYSDYEVDVAFLGDSLTDGYDVARFYPDYLVANRGIGGETTFGLEDRMQVSLYDLKPKVAVVLIGANNMDTMLYNYERMIADIRETLPDTELVICSLTSMSQEWGRKNFLAAYNNVTLKIIAKNYGCQFVDLYSALFNIETGELYDEYTVDGGHLTEAGYNVLTAEITPAIKAALEARK